jgi:hypothetical protein
MLSSANRAQADDSECDDEDDFHVLVDVHDVPLQWLVSESAGRFFSPTIQQEASEKGFCALRRFSARGVPATQLETGDFVHGLAWLLRGRKHLA